MPRPYVVHTIGDLGAQIGCRDCGGWDPSSPFGWEECCPGTIPAGATKGAGAWIVVGLALALVAGVAVFAGRR